jgi:hypothetical protein
MERSKDTITMAGNSGMARVGVGVAVVEGGGDVVGSKLAGYPCGMYLSTDVITPSPLLKPPTT